VENLKTRHAFPCLSFREPHGGTHFTSFSVLPFPFAASPPAWANDRPPFIHACARSDLLVLALTPLQRDLYIAFLTRGFSAYSGRQASASTKGAPIIFRAPHSLTPPCLSVVVGGGVISPFQSVCRVVSPSGSVVPLRFFFLPGQRPFTSLAGFANARFSFEPSPPSAHFPYVASFSPPSLEVIRSISTTSFVVIVPSPCLIPSFPEFIALPELSLL